MSYKENSLLMDGQRIAYLQFGDALQDCPIIYLHGWLDNAASFEGFAELIHQSGIAIDLPGHGRSDHLPPYCYYHFIDGVSCIIRLIDTLNIKKCILVGHSLGACIASIVASSIPEKIEKLVLLDAIGPLATSPEKSLARYRKYIKSLRMLASKKERIYSSIEAACRHRASLGYISAQDVKPIVTRGLKQSSEGFLWGHDQRLLLPSPLQMTQSHVLSFLSAVEAPTLLINASRGFKFDEQLYQQRVNQIKKISIKTIEAGHHIHIEDAQSCALLVNEFLGAN